eukprot:754287-Hanusia_phi.AAC.6
MSTAAPYFNQGSVTIAPRPRLGNFQSPLEVRLSLDALAPLFNTSQPKAAQQLGVSLTSLKAACRRLGISRWPYRRGARRSEVTIMNEESLEDPLIWYPRLSEPLNVHPESDKMHAAKTDTSDWSDENSQRSQSPPCKERDAVTTDDEVNQFLAESLTDEEPLSQDSVKMAEWIRWYINCEGEEMLGRPFY